LVSFAILFWVKIYSYPPISKAFQKAGVPSAYFLSRSYPRSYLTNSWYMCTLVCFTCD